MVQLWHLCLQRWCTSEFFSRRAGYQQMLCPAQGAGCKRADCSSVLQGESLPPLKLASLSGASYSLRIDGCFLEKDWKRLRDQKPSHLYPDISLSLYFLLFGFFTISQSSVCWWHLITTRSCISYFVWEIHWFNSSPTLWTFELCECPEVLLFERDTNAEVRYYEVLPIF